MAKSALRRGLHGVSIPLRKGINPTSKGMIGTQAIVAYTKPDGTMGVVTSPFNSYGTQLQEGNLSFPVSDLSASFLDNQMVIYAVIELPENTTSVSHVWQDGPVFGSTLGMHQVSRNHLQSMGTLNLSSGQASASHNTLWFYVHITLQLPGYLFSMAGGATGLYLGVKFAGVHHPCHMGIGITLFCLGLLQISALFLWPAKDHKVLHSKACKSMAWIIVYGVISKAMIVSTIVLEVQKRLTRDGNTIGATEASATSTREDNKVEILIVQ
ncbi:hypothetical protein RHSIM_Rhsim02G0092700 [Rhododendron simsii]|uniref:AIR12 DOMON domain-containing protein n=1 Tax=Rhododendron simsii TaxID=118357 RepID=A0A834HC18_RHOSS|nr:hypothetical protein RHSIM_Rhsim02G0092700 [Rhododendron simsii]